MSFKNWTIIEAFDLYENGTMRRRYYSKKKAINVAQTIGQNLFGIRRCEVVNSLTGEVVFSIN